MEFPGFFFWSFFFCHLSLGITVVNPVSSSVLSGVVIVKGFLSKYFVLFAKIIM